MTTSEIEDLAIKVIRGISMDAPHAARSGHQGTAMALAPLAHVLWTRILNYDASDPLWPDRDRFILSAGHASILLYSMLYLTGHGLTLDDLKNFRQWGSLTPGHPEVGHTAGVEVTTGPLGQGVANAVGMALAERNLRARFGEDACSHYTYFFCGDGDLAEGISHESASFAGHQRLGRLIGVYDDNHISIDGPTELALSDDAVKRFEGYGWHVIDLGESGEDLDAIENAFHQAKSEDERPSLIILRTHIGTPSPDIDTADVHGYSLKDDKIADTKKKMGLPEDETFYCPQEVLDFYHSAGRRGASIRDEWVESFKNASIDVESWEACQSGTGLQGWQEHVPSWEAGESVATRKASNICFQALSEFIPGLIGGGADLTGNTGTSLEGFGVQSAECPEGRQIYFGVREHAMGGISNGIALHGGFIPVNGTFFVFADYMRASVRLAALSNAKNIFVWSHDSVGVGEDGPTHQPVEHLSSLRSMPNLQLFRPADANETVAAWVLAINHSGPTGLILTRQDVPVLDGTGDINKVAKGAYVLAGVDLSPDLVIIGTGSEVSVALEAAELIKERGVNVRVVSMPCMQLFESQDAEYRSSVLPEGVPVISIEAGSTFGWHQWSDVQIGIDRFGASAPGETVMKNLGITPEAVLAAAEELTNS